MEVNGQIFVGYDKGEYIHIYREGKGVMESIRIRLTKDGRIVASPSSKKVWRDWAVEAYEK